MTDEKIKENNLERIVSFIRRNAREEEEAQAEGGIGPTCVLLKNADAMFLVNVLSETPYRWRLASDKPTRGGHVLAYDAARQFMFIVTEHFDWWGHVDPQGRKEFDAPKFTHWMPLPEAPK